MISDVLREAIQEIERYQAHDVFGPKYEGIREWIDRVEEYMERLKDYLDDSHPNDEDYPELNNHTPPYEKLYVMTAARMVEFADQVYALQQENARLKTAKAALESHILRPEDGSLWSCNCHFCQGHGDHCLCGCGADDYCHTCNFGPCQCVEKTS